jgi:adenylate cyclase
MEFTCLGATVNIASRLQSQAREGGVVISAATKRLLDDSLEFSGPRKVRVKGIHEEIEVYDLVLNNEQAVCKVGE